MSRDKVRIYCVEQKHVDVDLLEGETFRSFCTNLFSANFSTYHNFAVARDKIVFVQHIEEVSA